MSEYIWNGLGLTTPEGWEPAALERDGLLLECDARPMCELKWRTVHGSFSFEKHMKKLSRGNKGVEIHAVPEDVTPATWREALATLAASGMHAQSFIWGMGEHKGIGAALHHPATGLAVLVQFFVARESDEIAASQVLASLRNYSGGKTIPWAMFGLSARLPAAYRLDTFSFKPGQYTVKFWLPKSGRKADKLPAGKGPGIAVTFERFAPASVLLKGCELGQWVVDHIEGVPKTDSMTQTPGVVAWDIVEKASMLRKVLRRQKYNRGRVWATYAGNAIVSVRATGTSPMEDEIFNDMVTSYELV